MTAGLQAQVDALRAELAELRAQLGREVRTERLVVVHPDDGRELIATRRLDGSVTLEVCWDRGEDGFPKVGITSNDESVEADACVYVTAGGSVAAMLGATRRDVGDQQRATSDPYLWLDAVPSHSGTAERSLRATPRGRRDDVRRIDGRSTVRGDIVTAAVTADVVLDRLDALSRDEVHRFVGWLVGGHPQLVSDELDAWKRHRADSGGAS